jgi:hypothetical protein
MPKRVDHVILGNAAKSAYDGGCLEFGERTGFIPPSPEFPRIPVNRRGDIHRAHHPAEFHADEVPFDPGRPPLRQH